MLFCTNCGKELAGDARFCGACGGAVAAQSAENAVDTFEVIGDENPLDVTVFETKDKPLAVTVFEEEAEAARKNVGLLIFGLVILVIGGVGIAVICNNASYTGESATTGDISPYKYKAPSLDEVNNAGAGGQSAAAPKTQSQSSTTGITGFTDSRDGKTYRVVTIGGQMWMAENMNYRTGRSWCYDDDNSNCAEYGRLYDWNTAKSVCPAGARLPTNGEWNKLVAAAGGDYVAGRKLKSKTVWDGGGGGFDDYGFSALPGCFRLSEGIWAWCLKSKGFWWTATERSGNGAHFRWMESINEGVYEDFGDKDGGLSVRCVIDNPALGERAASSQTKGWDSRLANAKGETWGGHGSEGLFRKFTIRPRANINL
jgi:uncharacterized protein (TIGR02145 family)